ncbi:uncharacterized protein arhgap20b [Engraulis encrasicolus]|uniref:uncharacterized protein arhgap20b n=1 Tax=Engraulis encrasicolus TaxID=184585 RepID=UPI002FD6014B
MSPQHRAANPHNTPLLPLLAEEAGSVHEKKKMKTMLQRRRTAQSVISRALSKPKAHSRSGVISAERRPWNVNQPDASVTHGSFFVMEEHVHLSSGPQTQERHLFLFTDVLIIAKSKSSASLKVKAQVRLSEMWLSSCVEQVSERKFSPKNSFVIGWPTTNYVVTLSSSEAKEKWLSTLQWYIIQSKQNELPSKIVTRVTVLDDSVITAALQLDSSTTADHVIQMIALQRGLKGPPAEYQLWVETAGEEAPCVLIGHELPYAMVLHQLRLAECLSAVRSNLLTAEGTLHLELVPREVLLPLFTLRSRANATRHAHTHHDHFSQKIRRKKSLIDWALRRGGTHGHGHSQASCPSGGPCSSALFGQPLSSICPRGNPPPPVLDMLLVLYEQGPSTPGIFRRSANAKSCRELKEKLNAGLAYLPPGESVFVVAALLTDFLRSLPDSALGSHLYERWMEAAQMVATEEDEEDEDEEDEDERNGIMASLVSELPEENATLLRFVFWVLHHIHQHAEENQMTASNLALCIAPNMLSPPAPTSASASNEDEAAAMKKVAELIQLLIENTPSIFGEDVGGLLMQWKAVRDEHAASVAAETETYLHPNWKAPSVPSPAPASLLVPDPFLIPLAALALREDGCGSSGGGGILIPSVSASSVSVCSLPAAMMGDFWSSRDRCASEPTVCPVPPPHTSVARQSSCDAAVTGASSFSQSQSPNTQARRGAQQAKWKSWWMSTMADSTSSPRPGAAGGGGGGGGGSSGAGKGRYALWRSPQTAPRFRHTGHLLPPSSLPSTAASSLSSLDSALSLTVSSSETLSSPNDDSSPSLARPFLFGSSARLRPLTPDVPRKWPADWSMTFPQERRKHSRCEEEEEERCEEEEEEEEEEEDEEQVRIERVERAESALMMEPPLTPPHHHPHTGSVGSHLPDVRMTVQPVQAGAAPYDDGDGEQVSFIIQGTEGAGGQHHGTITPLSHHGQGQVQGQGQGRVQGRPRETSVAHIILSSPTASLSTPTPTPPPPQACPSLPPEVESVQRTKITFYASSATVTVKDPSPVTRPLPPLPGAGVDAGAGWDADVADMNPAPANPAAAASRTVQVHVPQTVFYGQSAPLVLRSVSTRVPVASSTTTSGTADGGTQQRNSPRGSSTATATATHTCITLPGGINVFHSCHGGTEVAAVINGSESTQGAVQAGDEYQCLIGSADVDVDYTGAKSCPGQPSTDSDVCQSSAKLEQPPQQRQQHHHHHFTSGIRHTIRIKLPAAVRNTVRDYFSHGEAQDRDGSGNSANAQSAAVEKELLMNRLQWQRRDPHRCPTEGISVEGPAD